MALRRIYPAAVYEPGCFEDGFIPERTLLAAVLERSFRDLSYYVKAKFRKQAIEWFECRHKNVPFTFTQVIQELSLKPSEMAFIFEKVQLAKQYGREEVMFARRKGVEKETGQEVKEQGQTPGTGMGKLLETTWDRFCPTYRTILRKRRAI